MDKDALKKLKKQYEQKSKEVLKDIDHFGQNTNRTETWLNAELMRRRIRKGAVDARLSCVKLVLSCHPQNNRD